MNFTFNFVKDQLFEFIGQNPNIEDWYNSLYKFLPIYNINTKKRVSAFMAQCAHESGKFSRTTENLNYSANGLLKTFSKYFQNMIIAQKYANKPEAIANRVYADRMGNSDEFSGDGWKYRGRGLIQLTGKDNYISFSKSLDITLEEAIEYLETFDGAVQSSCWFWKVNNLNDLADTQDIIKMTKKINGGLNGIDDRKELYKKAISIFQ